MTCSRCGKSHKSESRVPRGWKRFREAIWCDACWNAAFVLRAVTIPIVSPITGSWEELRAALREAWINTTQAANWMMTEMYARDHRKTGDAKMPPMSRVYLYPEAREKFPSLSPQSIASLEQAVQRKYRAKRYDVAWTANASLPTMRYPQPLPIHNQSWSVGFDEGNRPVVSARIGSGDEGKRWEFRLKGGARYRRQLAAVRDMVNGSAPTGELALFKHHDGTILCKMVAWLPRKVRGTTTGQLSVRTAQDSLLIAVDAADERIWTYNADHLRRWIAEYDRSRQRLAEDQKAEQRPTPSFSARRDTMILKQRNRMDSAVKEIAASLAAFARRRKVAEVLYDDSETGFAGEGFPYFALRQRIAVKLDDYGIGFSHASGEAEAEQQEPLAEGEM